MSYQRVKFSAIKVNFYDRTNCSGSGVYQEAYVIVLLVGKISQPFDDIKKLLPMLPCERQVRNG